MTTDDGLYDHCACCAHRRSPGQCGGPDCRCKLREEIVAAVHAISAGFPHQERGAQIIADAVMPVVQAHWVVHKQPDGALHVQRKAVPGFRLNDGDTE